MKILIYTHEYPPFKGGAGVYSRDLAIGLASLNVEVHVLSVKKCNNERIADGIHFHFFDDTGTAAVQRSLCILQLAYLYDIILITERRAQEIVALMPKGLFPYAAVIHGTEILNYFSNHDMQLQVDRRRMAAFYETASVCIAVSKATAEMAKGLFPGVLPIAIVPNGIDPQRLHSARVEDMDAIRQSYPLGAQIVFCLGRLDLDKGQDVLIKAFVSVRRICPRAYLLIGGVGPNRSSLEALRKELQLEDCVDFLGEISQANLPIYFDLCWLFTMPSKCDRRWEGFGLVYLEAGYYGKPVIGGKEGGVPEAIAHRESGLLVDARDSESVAAAIVELLTDDDKAQSMGAMGRQRVIRYFNAKRMAEDTLGVLRTFSVVTPINKLERKTLLAGWVVYCNLRLLIGKFLRLTRLVRFN